MDEAAIDAQLAGMALTDLWGVAGRLAARLQELGIANPLALKRADPRFLRQHFNVVGSGWCASCRACPASRSRKPRPSARV